MAAVELQLCSAPLFLFTHRQTNGIQYQIDCLLCIGLVGNDTVIIKIPDHGKIQHALLCVEVRNICYPFAVRSVRVKLTVQQVFVFMYLLPHIDPFSAPPDIRKQTVFLHDTQDGLGITVDAPFLQHQPQPAVAISICTKAALSLLRNDFCEGSVFLWSAQTMGEIIISAERSDT